MAHAHEYSCGCIVHSLAGVIRKCPGTASNSLSGRAVSCDEGSASAHRNAMNADDPVRTYELAEVLP